jgi:DNA-binding transcriptional ArsR family regulator
LLPILKSRLVGELLALINDDPARRWTARELTDRTAAAYQTVTRELRVLTEAGLILDEHVGRTRIVRANTTSPFFSALAELTIKAFGAPQVLAEELAAVSDIDEAWLFGSWAARYEGTPGPPPNDIDVMVLGTPDRDALHDAVQRAEQRLGRPVNATVRTPTQWHDADDGFTRQVKASPRVTIPSSSLGS